jgi:transposase
MVKCTKKEIRILKKALRWKLPAVQRERIQMVLLRETGMTQPAIAEAMGVSLSTVNRAHMAYDAGGIKALKPKPIGGRQRENMTLVEEKALMARFAKAAGAGEMLNIHDLKAAYEKAIGHETSNSTVYNLLARHGWRKLVPRPRHPQRDLAPGRILKKRLSTRFKAGSARGCPARPQVGYVCRRSAVRSDEPAAAVLGAAIHQAAGGLPACSRVRLPLRRSQPRGWNLRLSHHASANTECFQIFLQTLVRKYRRQFILLFVDGAGNRHSDELKVPGNIMLHFLPLYSPELNPQSSNQSDMEAV